MTADIHLTFIKLVFFKYKCPKQNIKMYLTVTAHCEIKMLVVAFVNHCEKNKTIKSS